MATMGTTTKLTVSSSSSMRTSRSGSIDLTDGQAQTHRRHAGHDEDEHAHLGDGHQDVADHVVSSLFGSDGSGAGAGLSPSLLAERHPQFPFHPAAKLLVHHRRAQQGRQVELPVGRMKQERSGLGPTQAAMCSDELLEGRDLTGLGIELADDRDVTHVLDRIEALDRGDGVLPVDGQRVDTLDLAVIEAVDAVLVQAKEPAGLRPDHDEADAGVAARAWIRSG